MIRHMPVCCFLTLIGLFAAFANADPVRPETRYASLNLPRNTAEKAAMERPVFSIADPTGPSFTEEQKAMQRNAGEALLHKIRTTSRTLLIPPGDYRFSSKSPIVLEGLHDLKIMANGVTFWMERPADQITADSWGWRFFHCRNVSIKGLTLDYDPALYMQGRIDSIDYTARTVDLVVDEDFPLVDYHPLQIIFFRANGEYIPQPTHFHDGAKVIGDRRLRVTMKTMDPFRAQNEDPKILEAFEGRCKIGVGDYAVLPFRTSSAIEIEQCAAMRFVDVTLYAAPGFAFMESGGGGGHEYVGCKVIRRPGTCRLWAGNADAFHSRMLKKGSRLERCEFSYIGDDFLNFHSFWHLVTSRIAPNRFVIVPHKYEPFSVGKPIAFYDQVSAASQGSATITAIEPLNDPGLIEKSKQTPEKYGFIPFHEKPIVVTLNRDVAATEGSLVDSRTFNSPGIVVKDCYFHDGMGRGALVEGVEHVRFENNTWRDCNGGIQMFSCMWFYVEGPFTRYVTIRNNRFLNADAIPAPVQQHQPINGTICMSLVANGGNYLRDVVNSRGLQIVGNTFYRPMNYAVLVAYTHDVTVSKNRIIEPRRYVSRIGYDASPPYYKNANGVSNPESAILITRSEKVKIDRNEVQDPEGILKETVSFGPGVKP